MGVLNRTVIPLNDALAAIAEGLGFSFGNGKRASNAAVTKTAFTERPGCGSSVLIAFHQWMGHITDVRKLADQLRIDGQLFPDC